MAAGSWTVFTKSVEATHKALIDWSSANIRCALLGSGYTPNATAAGHGTWADVSTNQVTGTGYTAGGVAVTSPTVASTGSTTTASGTIAAWANATITAKYAVLVLSTGGATIAGTDKLLAYVDLETSGTISSSNGQFSVSGYSVAVTHTP